MWANETEVFIENEKVKGLIDSRAQVSSISDTFASKLGLKIKQLDTLLDLEPTGVDKCPMMGMLNYVCEFLMYEFLILMC